jgi:predicted O-methyltransferase YrrM
MKEARYPLVEATPFLVSLNRVKGIVDMMTSLPPLERVLEVGCFRGVSTEVFALYAQRVFAVDLWEEESIFVDFQKRMQPYKNVKTLRGRSPGMANHFEDDTLDLVYIDGDHTQEAVRADILAWLPKIRKGGWISGHDWTAHASHVQVIDAVLSTIGKPDHFFCDTSWIKQKKLENWMQN